MSHWAIIRTHYWNSFGNNKISKTTNFTTTNFKTAIWISKFLNKVLKLQILEQGILPWVIEENSPRTSNKFVTNYWSNLTRNVITWHLSWHWRCKWRFCIDVLTCRTRLSVHNQFTCYPFYISLFSDEPIICAVRQFLITTTKNILKRCSILSPSWWREIYSDL